MSPANPRPAHHINTGVREDNIESVAISWEGAAADCVPDDRTNVGLVRALPAQEGFVGKQTWLGGLVVIIGV